MISFDEWRFSKINQFQSTLRFSIPETSTPFFNLSKHSFTDDEQSLFLLGLKHIPMPPDTRDQSLDFAYTKFANSAKWTSYFYDKSRFIESTVDNSESNFNPHLKIPTRKSIQCNFLDKNHLIHKPLQSLKALITLYKNQFPPRKKIPNQFANLLKLRSKFTDVVFKPADKNLGLVALDIKHYHRLVMDHLNDNTTYTKVPSDFYSITILKKKLQKKYDILCGFTGDSLNDYFAGFNDYHLKFLKSHSDFVFPNFYILPKLHKSGPIKGRPISGAVNFYTTPISKILNEFLKPYMLEIESKLTNSKQLVDELTFPTTHPSNLTFISADVNALYPSIDINLLLRIFHNNNDIQHLTQLVDFVCNNSYTSYNNTIYRQIKGIAMGTNCAVALADIYMDFLIDKLIHPFTDPYKESFFIHGYKRYIDDLFFVTTSDSLEKLDKLKHLLSTRQNMGLFLTWAQPSNQIDFLDISISQSPFTNEIKTRVFQKELNKYIYISPNSNHVPHILKGFIKGELTRYANLSSDFYTYHITKQKFFQRLRNRGYPLKMIQPIFNNHNWSSRFTSTTKSSKLLPFVIPYSKRRGLTEFELQFKEIANEINDILPANSAQIVYSRTSNIKDILCPSALSRDQAIFLRPLSFSGHLPIPDRNLN